MSICGSLNVQAIVSQIPMSRQRLTFSYEEFSMAINDAGMFTVKEINASKSFRMSSIAISVLDRLPNAGHHATSLQPSAQTLSPVWALGMNNQSRGRTGNRLLPAS